MSKSAKIEYHALGRVLMSAERAVGDLNLEPMKTRGVIFDLDGTLVDSHLNFDRMRREMGLVAEIPILEAMQEMTAAEAARCRDILHHYERIGAEQATFLPGVAELLEEMARRRLSAAVVTRNSRPTVRAMLSRLAGENHFDPVLTRDDGPVKPDPWAIRRICEIWSVSAGQLVMIGDYYFDILFGRRAGARTVMFTRGRDRAELPGADQADFLLDSFLETDEFWEWLTAGSKPASGNPGGC